jgi:hypothetical protein
MRQKMALVTRVSSEKTSSKILREMASMLRAVFTKGIL